MSVVGAYIIIFVWSRHPESQRQYHLSNVENYVQQSYSLNP